MTAELSRPSLLALPNLPPSNLLLTPLETTAAVADLCRDL